MGRLLLECSFTKIKQKKTPENECGQRIYFMVNQLGTFYVIILHARNRNQIFFKLNPTGLKIEGCFRNVLEIERQDGHCKIIIDHRSTQPRVKQQYYHIL